ncbi:MAG: YbhB/YbcL family Raf kinase inhibitor-like protein [Gammaproteobacteria bacterium]
MPSFASVVSAWIPRGTTVRRRRMAAAILVAMVFPAAGVAGGRDTDTGGRPMGLRIVSTAFASGGAIPARYTCDGADISPELAWSGVPKGAKSLVLVVDDPDAPDPSAPRMIWVHWVLYNLPPGSRGLAAAITPDALPPGTLPGTNDWKRAGYGGPCPPVGRHRYFYKLYALDVVLPDLHQPTKAQLEAAMHRHILAQAELLGTYQRER